MDISIYCSECRRQNRIHPDGTVPAELSCDRCGTTRSLRWPSEMLESGALDACVACGEPSLFRQKSFNRKLGLAIVITSIVLAPYTLYMSLFVGAAIDAVIYLLVPEVGICYNCETEYRDVQGVSSLDPFDHLIAQKIQARQEREAVSEG